MKVSPILETNRIHCFYRETYDLNLLPLGASQSGLIRTNMPNPDICVGESNTYDKLIKKYDKSVNFLELRNSWVTGKKVPLSDITVTVEEKKKDETKITMSDIVVSQIRRINELIRKLESQKQKLQSNNAPLEKIHQIDRQINGEQQKLRDTINREERRVRYITGSQNQTVQSVNSTRSYSDDSDDDLNLNFYSDDSDDDSNFYFEKEEVEVPSRQSTIVSVPTETEELSNAREALSAERMGPNRPDVVQRLRVTVNNLENANPRVPVQQMQRQTPPSHINANIDTLPLQVIEESIELARPTGSVTEDNVFDHLQLLQWRDKDEFKMAISQLNKIPIQTLNEMYPIMQNLAINLRTALAAQTGAIESMSDEDRNNFLFHVIAKGKELYYQSLCDADFCLYMLDTWQPLYSFMRKKLRRDD